MGLLAEFREFALEGNVVEFTVGVIVGGAFGKVTASLVKDVLMPPLGLLLGNVDFSKLAFVLREAQGSAPAISLRYGLFLNHLLDFLLIAAVVFLVVRWLNRRRRNHTEEASPAARSCRFCKSTIHPKATRCPHCTAQLKKA
jgi:large conductance mechanosensitive channel